MIHPAHNWLQAVSSEIAMLLYTRPSIVTIEGNPFRNAASPKPILRSHSQRLQLGKELLDTSIPLVQGEDGQASLGRNSGAASISGRVPVRVHVHRKLHKDLAELCLVQTLPAHSGTSSALFPFSMAAAQR